jgi:hypothetical protein
VENIVGLARHTRDRYVRLPPWVVLSQLFLGVGWLRAGVAHGLSRSWWNGDELLSFLAERRGQALPVYGLFLDGFVEPLPTGFAAVVLIAELGVGLALLANARPLEALAVGSFLNLHFIAAGQVNPSIFYLIIALGVVSWHVEGQLPVAKLRQLARIGTAASLAVAVLLLPAVETLAPAAVIDDPAAVLVLLAVLLAIAFWVAYLRRSDPSGGQASLASWFTSDEVVSIVEERTGYEFTADLHALAARKVGVRPPAGDVERTVKRDYAVYVTDANRYLYSQSWVDALTTELATAAAFESLIDVPPRVRRVAEQGVEEHEAVPSLASTSSSRDQTLELVGVRRSIDEREVDQPGFEIVVKM